MGVREDRLVVAAVTGLAERMTGGFGDCAESAQWLRAALDARADPHGVVAGAVARLHDVTRDVGLLSRAAANYLPAADAHWFARWALLLLQCAGADPGQVERWRGEDPPWRFHPPQADPGRHRTIPATG